MIFIVDTETMRTLLVMIYLPQRRDTHTANTMTFFQIKIYKGKNNHRLKHEATSHSLHNEKNIKPKTTQLCRYFFQRRTSVKNLFS